MVVVSTSISENLFTDAALVSDWKEEIEEDYKMHSGKEERSLNNQTGITQLEKDLVDGLKVLGVDNRSMVAIMVMLQTEEQEMLRQMATEVDMDLFWKDKEKAIDNQLARALTISERMSP